MRFINLSLRHNHHCLVNVSYSYYVYNLFDFLCLSEDLPPIFWAVWNRASLCELHIAASAADRQMSWKTEKIRKAEAESVFGVSKKLFTATLYFEMIIIMLKYWRSIESCYFLLNYTKYICPRNLIIPVLSQCKSLWVTLHCFSLNMSWSLFP